MTGLREIEHAIVVSMSANNKTRILRSSHLSNNECITCQWLFDLGRLDYHVLTPEHLSFFASHSGICHLIDDCIALMRWMIK